MVAALCVAAALAFAGFVWTRRGPELAQQFVAGYLIELSLSVDNVFVFVLVFQQFGIAADRQRRLLLWGVAGAIVLRISLLLAGLGAIARFSWLIPLFGCFVLFTGLRMAAARPGAKAFDPNGPLFRFVRRHAPAALAAVLVLETADLLFAFDSLPAVLAVTHDRTVAIASNLFAILGLRSLFFVVSAAVSRLRFLSVGVAAILCCVGLKMMAEPWYPVPTRVSLALVGFILAISAGASLIRPTRGA